MFTIIHFLTIWGTTSIMCGVIALLMKPTNFMRDGIFLSLAFGFIWAVFGALTFTIYYSS